MEVVVGSMGPAVASGFESNDTFAISKDVFLGRLAVESVSSFKHFSPVLGE